MTPEDILNAEFPEEAMARLHEAFGDLPFSTTVLWGLIYWLQDQGDRTGAGIVQEWANEFAEHEARRVAKLAQYGGSAARAPARRVAPSPAPSRRQASIDLGNCSLPEFAHVVKAVAREVRGPGKWHGTTFISAIWDDLTAHGADVGISLAAFKRRLVQAHQDDLLELSRADLVEAMPPSYVAESETTHGGARFHLLRLN